jgi:site-specific DNA-cytosine methylase
LMRIYKETKPKYFLFENVKMSKKWEKVISDAIGVEPILINSSLLTAQNRQRLYWTNIEGIEQPQDKGILLRDILETNQDNHTYFNENRVNKFEETLKENPKMSHNGIIQLNQPSFSQQRVYCIDGKSPTISAGNNGGGKEPCKIQLKSFEIPKEKSDKVVAIDNHSSKNGLRCIGAIDSNNKWLDDGKNLQRNFSQGERIYDTDGKSPTISANGGGTAGSSCIIKDNTTEYKFGECKLKDYNKESSCYHVAYATDINGHDSLKRVYHEDGKSPTVNTCQGGNREVKVLVNESEAKNGKAYCLTARYSGAVAWNSCERKQRTMIPTEESNDKDPNVYKGIRYRKLTPLECERLQSVPDNFTLVPYGKRMMSNSQRYKILGNGFTIDVIAHILSYIWKD